MQTPEANKRASRTTARLLRPSGSGRVPTSPWGTFPSVCATLPPLARHGIAGQFVLGFLLLSFSSSLMVFFFFSHLAASLAGNHGAAAPSALGSALRGSAEARSVHVQISTNTAPALALGAPHQRAIPKRVHVWRLSGSLFPLLAACLCVNVRWFLRAKLPVRI